MSNKYMNWLSGSLLSAVVLTGFTACSDDHFDIFSSGTSSESIWKNMTNQADLSNFRSVLERTITMRNSSDKNSTQTYAQLLDKNQVMTVWAPKDGTFDVSRWNSYLDKATAYRSAGKLDSALYYNGLVQYQFVNQHIANYTYESNPADQSLRLLNNKLAIYNAGSKTFNKISLDPVVPTVPSSNGTLHVLDGFNAYAYNIYDMLGAESNLSEIYSYIASQNVKKFSASASTAGGIDEKGNVQYVDSVYYTSNKFLNECGAAISNEDSIYVAVIPSNSCWPNAIAQISKLFHYKSSYAYQWSQSGRDFVFKGSNAQKVNGDSLQNVNARALIMNNMFYTVSRFPTISKTDSAGINNAMQMADTLKSTAGYYITNTNTPHANPIFAGATPKRASNGYIYEVNSYNYKPEYSFQTAISFDAESTYSYYAASTMKDGDSPASNIVSLTDENTDSVVVNSPVVYWDAASNAASSSAYPITLPTGNVSGKTYLRMQRNTATPDNYVDFKLFNVLSGKYDVYAGILPSRVNVNDSTYLGEGVQEQIIFGASLLDDQGNILTSVSKVAPPQAINVVKLFSDYKFENCYSGLPLTYGSTDNRTFARLRISLPSQRVAKACNALNIDYIVLVPKGVD